MAEDSGGVVDDTGCCGCNFLGSHNSSSGYTDCYYSDVGE